MSLHMTPRSGQGNTAQLNSPRGPYCVLGWGLGTEKMCVLPSRAIGGEKPQTFQLFHFGNGGQDSKEGRSPPGNQQNPDCHLLHPGAQAPNSPSI